MLDRELSQHTGPEVWETIRRRTATDWLTGKSGVWVFDTFKDSQSQIFPMVKCSKWRVPNVKRTASWEASRQVLQRRLYQGHQVSCVNFIFIKRFQFHIILAVTVSFSEGLSPVAVDLLSGFLRSGNLGLGAWWWETLSVFDWIFIMHAAATSGFEGCMSFRASLLQYYRI